MMKLNRKSGMIVVAIAVIGLIAATAYYYGEGGTTGTQSTSGTFNGTSLTTITENGSVVTLTVIENQGSATSESFDSYGPITSLTNARVDLAANASTFVLPTSLPNSLTAPQIRATKGLAAIIYNASGTDNAGLIILVMKDGTSFYFPNSSNVSTEEEICSSSSGSGTSVCSTVSVGQGQTQQEQPVQVSISGHPGWGYDGFLNWWSGNLHYAVKGDFSLSTLESVGNSMNT